MVAFGLELLGDAAPLSNVFPFHMWLPHLSVMLTQFEKMEHKNVSGFPPLNLTKPKIILL
jgi:hypothetical protein